MNLTRNHQNQDEKRPSDNFLLKILKSSARDEIKSKFKSYKFPFDMIFQSEADWDPLTIGEDDFSAFHHCILLNDWNLYFLFYNHVIRKFSTNESITDEQVLSQLKFMRDLIEREKNAYLDLPHSSDEINGVTLVYDQIMRINQYQLEILDGILSKTKEKSSFEIQIDVMLFLIDKYMDYFFFDDPSTDDQFENFYQNYEYHLILDNFTCLGFFDRFLLLNAQIDGCNKEVFINVFESILKYFLSINSFPESPQNFDFNSNFSKDIGECFIHFTCRLKWKKALSRLVNELGRAQPTENKSIHFTAIHFMEKFPLLKDEFLLNRLKKYFTIGINVPVLCSDPQSNKSLKAVLVIERTLQVIGETMCEMKKNNPVTSLLQYCLPLNIQKVFKNVRNRYLSHCNAIFVPERRVLEEGNLSTGIQEDLKKMGKFFLFVHGIQHFRGKNNFIEESTKEENDPNCSIYRNLETMKKESAEKLKKFYEEHENICVSIVYAIFDALDKNLDFWTVDDVENFLKHLESLNILLSVITENSDGCSADTFSNILRNIKEGVDRNDEKGIIKNSLNELILLFSRIKKDVRSQTLLAEGDFPHFNQLFENMKRLETFTPEEINILREAFLKTSDKAQEQLLDHYRGVNTLTKENVIKLWENCLVTGETKSEVKRLIKKEKDKALDILANTIGNVDLLLGKEKDTCHSFMKLLSNHKYIDVISNLCLPKPLHDKISSFRFRIDFLIDRMTQLEEVLINDDKRILAFREFFLIFEGIDYTVPLLIERYVTEKDTMAALEMLLLDCLEILDKKGFDDLVKKISFFFKDINLRNMLSHGYPVMEASIHLLDPKNLPRELIRTALDVIAEQPYVSALNEFWKKQQRPGRERLRDLLNELSDSEEYGHIIKEIKKSSKWENYLIFFPNE